MHAPAEGSGPGLLAEGGRVLRAHRRRPDRARRVRSDFRGGAGESSSCDLFYALFFFASPRVCPTNQSGTTCTVVRGRHSGVNAGKERNICICVYICIICARGRPRARTTPPQADNNEEKRNRGGGGPSARIEFEKERLRARAALWGHEADDAAAVTAKILANPARPTTAEIERRERRSWRESCRPPAMEREWLAAEARPSPLLRIMIMYNHPPPSSSCCARPQRIARRHIVVAISA